MKPILFNTEMVRAILEGRKTVTRRPVKVRFRDGEAGYNIIAKAHTGEFCYLEVYDDWEEEVRRLGAPYWPGDILYVRETWTKLLGSYIYKANQRPGMKNPGKWFPSIHMPKEAARIFLRVKSVRVERLQCITRDEALKEGANPACATMNFKAIWESTTKPADLDKYGWDANPWVWVIEFERIDNPGVGQW